MLATTFNLMRSKAHFVHQFIKHPRSMGSLTPSSITLCNTMAEGANWSSAMAIAELGAGDGVLTRILLSRMQPQARLDAFEISPSLLIKLRAIDDPRLKVRPCSAEYLAGKYDVIFSGLPLLSLPVSVRDAVLSAVRESLTPDGVFIQFQYTSLTQQDLSRYFIWERTRVLKNIPPAWVYRCMLNYRS
ncbi:methyltransferase domain-containing protein [Prodigiosinella confusarubida]|uniref:Methyltransferase domain-containing protein n=1 Tax=Serratia sp. (strain ATCC 39006) TaxID=104623 RepID=A0A2I5TPB5_SERS3|nr:methyltransferase [Serratia sp. ATCC 39006]AUH02083.1 methyltransferase domain-containing protein [Serratia sp. ATCC 39006]AUH06404.1 methyltransferase domain-containing protein [Serratia sp. ATCC 39006]